jgi:hypothetical protein
MHAEASDSFSEKIVDFVSSKTAEDQELGTTPLCPKREKPAADSQDWEKPDHKPREHSGDRQYVILVGHRREGSGTIQPGAQVFTSHFTVHSFLSLRV